MLATQNKNVKKNFNDKMEPDFARLSKTCIQASATGQNGWLMPLS